MRNGGKRFDAAQTGLPSVSRTPSFRDEISHFGIPTVAARCRDGPYPPDFSQAHEHFNCWHECESADAYTCF